MQAAKARLGGVIRPDGNGVTAQDDEKVSRLPPRLMQTAMDGWSKPCQIKLSLEVQCRLVNGWLSSS